MKTYYISPALIPSRAANSIHVVNMCEALAKFDGDVTLFVRSESLNSTECNDMLQDYYGINAKHINIVVYRSRVGRGAELLIAIYALLHFIKDLLHANIPKSIISRNLYGAVLFGLLFRRRVVYETHAPDKGFRKYLQGWLIQSSRISSVVISDGLRKVIELLHGEKALKQNIHVLHDAARSGQAPMGIEERKDARRDLLGNSIDINSFDKIVGYFGHLYSGRGIEVIQGVAAKNPKTTFIVYGGNEAEIKEYTDNNSSTNLFFMGYLQPGNVRKAMAMMDVLLMPYQEKVSIGLGDIDTAQWMSPMKLFEYMAVGVPIISSNLPVLREILTNRENCLLVAPDDINAWSEALRSLTPTLSSSISSKAYRQYLENYTWDSRAKKMLELSKCTL